MYFANEPRWKTNRWPCTVFCMLNPTFKLKIFIIKMKIRNKASYLSCAALYIMHHRYQVQTFHKIVVECVSKFCYIISEGVGRGKRRKKRAGIKSNSWKLKKEENENIVYKHMPHRKIPSTIWLFFLCEFNDLPPFSEKEGKERSHFLQPFSLELLGQWDFPFSLPDWNGAL